MTFLQAVLLFLAAVIAGGMNSIAGGGSFILFPTIRFLGGNIPSLNANATNTIALWPGSVVSIAPYRKELAKQDRGRVLGLMAVSLIGGVLGAILLRATPATIFDKILPFLLLVATLLFTFSKRITQFVNRLFKRPLIGEDNRPSPAAIVIQLVIATYGGYFGGGIGVLMLTLLSLMGMTNIHSMNALKVLLASLINGVAVIIFVLSGLVYWDIALITIAGAVLGGYGGASLALRLDPQIARRIVIAIAFFVTILFFIRTYAA